MACSLALAFRSGGIGLRIDAKGHAARPYHCLKAYCRPSAAGGHIRLLAITRGQNIEVAPGVQNHVFSGSHFAAFYYDIAPCGGLHVTPGKNRRGPRRVAGGFVVRTRKRSPNIHRSGDGLRIRASEGIHSSEIGTCGRKTLEGHITLALHGAVRHVEKGPGGAAYVLLHCGAQTALHLRDVLMQRLIIKSGGHIPVLPGTDYRVLPGFNL